jgi:hypothetical protein
MNSPYLTARDTYEAQQSVLPFEECLLLHLEHGFVFATPEYFVMGRAVPRWAQPEHITNPKVWWPREECNCWWLYLVSGDTQKLWDVMPYPLGWVGWERIHGGKSELHFAETERIRRIHRNFSLNEPVLA